MFLIVGLGNPGSEYRNNRHNIGFMAADELVRRYNFTPWRSRFSGETAEGTIDGEKVLVLKPLTFMNNSGQAVRAAMDFYKLPVGNVIVIHDELDIPVGKIKAKTGGGAGGHNGLKSIDAHCTPQYARIRIGIGHPGDKNLVVPYVLSDVPKADRQVLDSELEDVAEALPVLLKEGTGGFTGRLALMHSRKG
ncbi:MAG: aminoacyl-tRNA hydrolase [Alphaproteobacteria bacterium]|jgi:PTH1 family peptidyl-tRNA hydrolase